MLFHYNNGCTNASQYYVMRKLPLLCLLGSNPIHTASTPRSHGLTGPHFPSISKRSSSLVDSVTVDWLMEWWLTITSLQLGACRSANCYQTTLQEYCCVWHGKQMHASLPLRKKGCILWGLFCIYNEFYNVLSGCNKLIIKHLNKKQVSWYIRTCVICSMLQLFNHVILIIKPTWCTNFSGLLTARKLSTLL